MSLLLFWQGGAAPEEKSGTGAISQSHTATATGTKAVGGSQTISQTHSMPVTGAKGGLGSQSISQTNSTTISGTPQMFGTGSISQSHNTTAEGINTAKSGTGQISQSHSIDATGTKTTGGIGSITHTPSDSATGLRGTEGFAIVSIDSLMEMAGYKSALSDGLIEQTHSMTATGTGPSAPSAPSFGVLIIRNRTTYQTAVLDHVL